jgi:predicted house-cleaning noncanonical NTP pyrophosphatase (MazG superfamily)
VNIEFPDREEIATLAAAIADEDIPALPEGIDNAELLDICNEALKTAVDKLSLEEQRPLEDHFEGTPPYHGLTPALLEELGIPTLMLSEEHGVPMVVSRIITKDGVWLGELKFDLMFATGRFVGEHFNFQRGLESSGVTFTSEDRRTFAINGTAELLKSALHKLKDRIEITINSFADEVFLAWVEVWYEENVESNSLKGNKTKRFSFSKFRDKTTKKHDEVTREFWKDHSTEQLSDLKKQLLALYYKKTFEHWKLIQDMQLDGKNWRRYVKAGDMSDITDDLIEDFENDTDLSGLALEHAARRAELFNIFNVNEKRLEKRRKGIKDSGYSRSRLFELKAEGESLLERRETTQSTSA